MDKYKIDSIKVFESHNKNFKLNPWIITKKFIKNFDLQIDFTAVAF